MARLSSPIEQLKSHYQVVVVGSGYGGGITASRLARAGQQVCVLERGKEFQPGDLDEKDNLIKAGEYPDTEFEAMREVQVDLPQFHAGSRTGLYDIRMNKEINVFVGCGLGGTSLVNANVCLEAKPEVFRQSEWPAAISSPKGQAEMAAGYKLAKDMLKPVPYDYQGNPATFPPLHKLNALEKSASHLQEPFYPPDINVNFTKFEDDTNHVGVEQHPCVGCGDCMSGCNYRAKNTLIMNYLPDAKNRGAEIFTEVSVRYLERKGSRWLVHYQLLNTGRERFDAPTMFLSADIVVLAAGTLGSTEVLLRSGNMGLPLSTQVGKKFSGNGDVLAFGYNCDPGINGIGFGHRSKVGRETVGPCITGIIDMRDNRPLAEAMVIEEGTVAGAFGAFLPKLFAAAAGLLGVDTDTGPEDEREERKRIWESLRHGAYRGAVQHSQTMLVMSHDDGKGEMSLDPKDDRLRISWPGVGEQPIFPKVGAKLQGATAALGGTYLKNPLSNKLMGEDLITVHPLGGCVMANDAQGGVVNHKGQVFSGPAGLDAYKNLYVSDGSVIPRSLGVNPLLTISAVAERCCALMAEDLGWTIKYDMPAVPKTKAVPLKLGVRFTESMRGYLSSNITDSGEDAYQRGLDQGRAEASPFEFIVTIISDDLERTVSDVNYISRMLGSVTAPKLSPEPLTVTNGEFNYFLEEKGGVESVGIFGKLLRFLGFGGKAKIETKRMQYKMRLTTEEGQNYYFYGFKVIRDDPGLDSWSDTTTLYVTLYEGENMKGRVVGKGILRIPIASFIRQMTTMQITNASGLEERWKGMLKFGRFFGGNLIDTYGANMM